VWQLAAGAPQLLLVGSRLVVVGKGPLDGLPNRFGIDVEPGAVVAEPPQNLHEL